MYVCIVVLQTPAIHISDTDAAIERRISLEQVEEHIRKKLIASDAREHRQVALGFDSDERDSSMPRLLFSDPHAKERSYGCCPLSSGPIFPLNAKVLVDGNGAMGLRQNGSQIPSDIGCGWMDHKTSIQSSHKTGGDTANPDIAESPKNATKMQIPEVKLTTANEIDDCEPTTIVHVYPELKCIGGSDRNKEKGIQEVEEMERRRKSSREHRMNDESVSSREPSLCLGDESGSFQGGSSDRIGPIDGGAASNGDSVLSQIGVNGTCHPPPQASQCDTQGQIRLAWVSSEPTISKQWQNCNNTKEAAAYPEIYIAIEDTDKGDADDPSGISDSFCDSNKQRNMMDRCISPSLVSPPSLEVFQTTEDYKPRRKSDSAVYGEKSRELAQESLNSTSVKCLASDSSTTALQVVINDKQARSTGFLNGMNVSFNRKELEEIRERSRLTIYFRGRTRSRSLPPSKPTAL